MSRVPAIVTMLLAATFSAAAQQVDWRSWPVRQYTPRPYDVQHYQVRLRFDHPKKRFYGTATITLVPTVSALRSCTFDAEVFTVRAARSENGVALTFDQRPGSVTVDLGREIHRSDTVRITLTYDGQQIEIDPARWGVSANYHIGLEFFDSTDAHPALVSSISFPEGARHWFPCNDHPSDKASQEMIIDVPAGWSAASNGSLVGVEPLPFGGSSFHWSLQEPHSTYLAVLAAGPYVVLRDSLGTRSLGYWVYPQHVPDALRTFHRTPEIIAFFERTYGVNYPWPKYDQILIPGIGGGAESTTATVLGQSTIHDERAEQDFPSHWLVAHEAAHQWWGDLVTFSDWGHTWINESFATYGEYLYSRWSLGEDEGAMNLQDKREQYFREARTKYRRPIVMDRWKFPNDNFDSHTYPKGANVLHMLRQQIGDRAFFGLLTKVLIDHAFGSATTRDILAAAEATSDTALGWFFDQWLMKPGHPVLSVSWRWDASAAAAIMRVEQQQDTTGGVPIFTLPVDVGITTPGGHKVVRIVVRQRVQEFSFPSSEQPILVEFDEPHALLAEVSFPRPPQELVVQLARGDAMSRVSAAGLLSTSDDPAIRSVLIRVAAEDPFWGVRRAAVTALGERAAAADTTILLERLTDQNPKVRTAVVRVLSRWTAPHILQHLQSRFFAEESYVVQTEIVRAVGSRLDTASVPFLEAASRVHSHRDMVRAAAIRALGEIRNVTKP